MLKTATLENSINEISYKFDKKKRKLREYKDSEQRFREKCQQLTEKLEQKNKEVLQMEYLFVELETLKQKDMVSSREMIKLITRLQELGGQNGEMKSELEQSMFQIKSLR